MPLAVTTRYFGLVLPVRDNVATIINQRNESNFSSDGDDLIKNTDEFTVTETPPKKRSSDTAQVRHLRCIDWVVKTHTRHSHE